MTIPIAAEPVPLEMDAEGVMRIGRTRVTLDTVIAAFVDGATAEEIVQQYPYQAEQRLFIPDFVSLHPGYGLANV
jgi:uncharacterized protein DUF433